MRVSLFALTFAATVLASESASAVAPWAPLDAEFEPRVEAWPLQWMAMQTWSANPVRLEPFEAGALAMISKSTSQAADVGEVVVELDDEPLEFSEDPYVDALEQRLFAPLDACRLTLSVLESLREYDPRIGAPSARIGRNGHTDKQGTWVEYDQIPRRPERPLSYDAYRYPIPSGPWGTVSSGYDLDRPDELQRRGKMRAVGHGGFDLAHHRGTPVKVLRLEHQVGDAEVLFVGPLMGITVVTRHAIREAGRARDYLMLFGHLDEPAGDIYRGRRLRAGEVVGLLGGSSSPDFIHLHLEVRRVRDGYDPWKLDPGALIARETTVVCDPRNVLPLRAPSKMTVACSRAPEMPKWFGGHPLSLGLGQEQRP